MPTPRTYSGTTYINRLKYSKCILPRDVAASSGFLAAPPRRFQKLLSQLSFSVYAGQVVFRSSITAEPRQGHAHQPSDVNVRPGDSLNRTQWVEAHAFWLSLLLSAAKPGKRFSLHCASGATNGGCGDHVECALKWAKFQPLASCFTYVLSGDYTARVLLCPFCFKWQSKLTQRTPARTQVHKCPSLMATSLRTAGPFRALARRPPPALLWEVARAPPYAEAPSSLGRTAWRKRTPLLLPCWAPS